MATRTEFVSDSFVWRRVHSLMGLWLVLYLIEHLIVNSQAALWMGDRGAGFVRLVNSLESLPFLHVIEIVFIGLPLVLHGYWGVRRSLSAKPNARKSDGSSPSLPFARNRAFSWQRLTSWILLLAILGHVIQMRFVDRPREVRVGDETVYVARVNDDPEMERLAQKIDVSITKELHTVTVTGSSPGKVFLFVVRETFKNPLMAILYTIFVLAAAFHAFNGLWTAFITWGVLLSYRSQKAFLPLCWVGMGLLAFLGLAAIWGSKW